MYKSSLFVGSLLLVLLLAVSSLQVQAQVTYVPNYAASDFTSLATTRTATIQYDLVGSPADSPFGSSFTVSFSLGAIQTSGTPLSYADVSAVDYSLTPESNNGAYLGIVISPGTTALQLADLINRPSYGLNLNRQEAAAGQYDANYNFSFETSAVPTDSDWALTSGGLSIRPGVVSGFTSTGGPPTSQWQKFFLVEGTVNPLDVYQSRNLGTDLSAEMFFVYTGTTSAALSGLRNDGGFNYNVGFQALTFAPVPEPSGVLLVGIAGVLLIVRRKRFGRV